ncbi:MAG: OmpA family protein, partial [bacterium]
EGSAQELRSEHNGVLAVMAQLQTNRGRLGASLALGSILWMLAGCSELYHLREENALQKNEIERLKAQSETYKQSYYKLDEEKNKELSAEKQRSAALKADMDAQAKARDAKEKQLLEENKELARVNQEIKGEAEVQKTIYEKEKADLLDQIADLTQKLDAANVELNRQKEAYAAATALAQKTQQDLDSEKTARGATQAQLTAKEDELAKAIAARDKLSETLKDREAEVKTLADSVQKGDERVQELTKQIETRSQPGRVDDEIKKKVADLESAAKEAFRSQLQEGLLAISTRDDGLSFMLESDTLFDARSAIVSENSMPILNRVGAFIKEHPGVGVDIEGHTDNQPLRDLPFYDNWGLSMARAGNVLNYLVEKVQVAPDRLRAIGASMYQPRADNSTPEGRRKNRRVEIVLKP